MIVHQTDYLETFYDNSNSLFIQNWIKSPENNSVFKHEMLQFVDKYRMYAPSKALWLHKNFNLVMDDDLKKWAEENVVNPCFKSGNEKCAFVVSKDLFSHLSIVDSFEGLELHKQIPRHFTSQQSAVKWLLEDVVVGNDRKEASVCFDGVDEEGNIVLKIKTSSDATNLLRLFQNVIDRDEFYNLNFHKFNALTTREKEVLLEYANGSAMKEISDVFNISIYTVRTHWRNVKRKLEIYSSIEAAKYLLFY